MNGYEKHFLDVFMKLNHVLSIEKSLNHVEQEKEVETIE